MNYIEGINLTKRYDLSDPLILRALTFKPKNILTAVDSINFSIKKGTTYGLVGESGSGKSTVAKMIVGLLAPSSGKITFDGKSFNDPYLSLLEKRALRRRIQMIFQSPAASLNPRWKVGSILLEPIQSFGLIDDTQEQNSRVFQLLEQVGLASNDANKFPHEFSGGQKQRISIARALSSQPEVIICDEPTSALDVSVQAQVLNLLKTLQKEHSLTYLFITHDLAVVSTMANKIGVLHNGKLIEEQDSTSLFANPLNRYTKMLLEAAPKISFL